MNILKLLPWTGTRFILSSLFIFLGVLLLPAWLNWSHADQKSLTVTESEFTSLKTNLLSGESFKLRIRCAMMLGRTGDKRAYQPLLGALNDEHYTVRGAAAIALGNLHNYAAIMPLMDQLHDVEPYVIKEVEKALENIAKNRAALPYLKEALNNPDAQIRLKAALLLENIEDNVGLETIVEALSDSDDKVRAVASEVIRGLNPIQAGELLLKALNNPKHDVKVEAIKRLGKLKEEKAIKPLVAILENSVESKEVFEESQKTLNLLKGYLRFDNLLNAYRNEKDKHQKAQAILLMGIEGSKKSYHALVAALNDRDIYLRGRAAMALRQLNDSQAIPILDRMLGDPANRRIYPIIQSTLKILKLGH